MSVQCSLEWNHAVRGVPKTVGNAGVLTSDVGIHAYVMCLPSTWGGTVSAHIVLHCPSLCHPAPFVLFPETQALCNAWYPEPVLHFQDYCVLLQESKPKNDAALVKKSVEEITEVKSEKPAPREPEQVERRRPRTREDRKQRELERLAEQARAQRQQLWRYVWSTWC